jgi:hypothetical protein
MNDTFVGKPVPEQFKIYYGGTVDETKGGGASSIESFKEEYDIEGDAVVKNIRYPVTAIGGLQTVVFTVQGTDGSGNKVSKDILVPASNLRTSGLDQMFNSPLYRMDQELDMHRVAGSLNPTIQFRNKDGVVTSSIQYELKEGGKGNDVAYILDANGEIVKTLPANSKTVTDEIEHAHSKGYTFRTQI